MPIEMIYQTGMAAMFAVHTRQSNVMNFMSSLDCRLGAYVIRQGDHMMVNRLGEGSLYAIAWIGKAAFAYINAETVNRLAGFELVKEEA